MEQLEENYLFLVLQVRDLLLEILEQTLWLRELEIIAVNMTGGHVTVLGQVGLNFGAGMTGGFAYILDEDRTFFDKCNGVNKFRKNYNRRHATT